MLNQIPAFVALLLTTIVLLNVMRRFPRDSRRKCKVRICRKGMITVPAYFHSWGLDFEDFGEHGPGMYSIAIVELEDGTIEKVEPEEVKFV